MKPDNWIEYQDKVVDTSRKGQYRENSIPAAPLLCMRNSVGFSFHKNILTTFSFSAKRDETKLNNTCHASADSGSICAPRRVAYTGAWR